MPQPRRGTYSPPKRPWTSRCSGDKGEGPASSAVGSSRGLTSATDCARGDAEHLRDVDSHCRSVQSCGWAGTVSCVSIAASPCRPDNECTWHEYPGWRVRVACNTSPCRCAGATTSTPT
eukprot:scaffold2482_cov407-Prasinococcus_capsulatus_cf.AAC.11